MCFSSMYSLCVHSQYYCAPCLFSCLSLFLVSLLPYQFMQLPSCRVSAATLFSSTVFMYTFSVLYSSPFYFLSLALPFLPPSPGPCRDRTATFIPFSSISALSRSPVASFTIIGRIALLRCREDRIRFYRKIGSVFIYNAMGQCDVLWTHHPLSLYQIFLPPSLPSAIVGPTEGLAAAASPPRSLPPAPEGGGGPTTRPRPIVTRRLGLTTEEEGGRSEARCRPVSQPLANSLLYRQWQCLRALRVYLTEYLK